MDGRTMTADISGNPGAIAAVNRGCRCPIIDNGHGHGARGTSGPEAHPDPNEFLPRMQAAIDDPANAAVSALLTSARDEVHHAWLVCDAAVFDAVKSEQSTRQQCVLWMQEARAVAVERDDLRARLAKLDRIEAKVPELIAWAESYRMNHVAIALRALVADAAHDCADISQADPRRYPVTDILLASPECTNHSQARGVSRRRQDPSLWDAPDPAALRDVVVNKWTVLPDGWHVVNGRIEAVS